MTASIALQRAIDEAVSILRRKGVVAFPTDTLYGLGADAFCEQAVSRVYDIKGRSGDMALPVLLGSTQDLQKVAINITDMAWMLVEHFWPGPLTLILEKSPQVHPIVTGGRDSVAVRMPDHHVPLTLVRELGSPVTGTSANPSGGPDPVTADDVRLLLGEKVDYIVDGGPATEGSPSTILDLTTRTNPRIVRLGAITHDTLQSFCSTPLEISRR